MSDKKGKVWGLQERIDNFLNGANHGAALVYELCSAILILVFCALFVADTYVRDPEQLARHQLIEFVITLLFLADYFIRWWAKRFSLLYLLTPLALIDLLAILPLVVAPHYQFIRILRLLRVLRLARYFRLRGGVLARFDEAYGHIGRVLFTIFCILFISAGFIYEIEHRQAPEVFATFFDAWYFSVVTLATVGYGDIVPQSTEGRMVVVAMISAGGLLLPWQLTKLANYLLRNRDRTEAFCPSCEHQRHEHDAHYCRRCGTSLRFQPGTANKVD